MERKRGRPGPPAPPGFEENAAELRNAELMRLYGVGRDTVARWRRETGVSGRLGGARPHRPNDSPEEIRACLTCPALGCTRGDCERHKMAAALAGGGE